MQGTIAQILSIAAYGNSFLAGKYDKGYFQDHTVFNHCEYVKFVDLEEKGEELIESDFASEPETWFERLSELDVLQYRIRYIASHNAEMPDRLSVAFPGGGGRWLIEVVKPSGSDFWEAHWEAGESEKQLWQVVYARIARDVKDPGPVLPPVEKVIDKLRTALQKISAFAKKHGKDEFNETFKEATQALSDRGSRNPNIYPIFPKNHAEAAHHKLLDAVQAAWVFGGRGSWNDIEFEDEETQQEYERLSDFLFSTMNLSLLVASNPLPRPEID